MASERIPIRDQRADQAPSTGNPFFDDEPDLETLAAQQGVKPIKDPKVLRGDFWPEDETADEFIAAVRRWRREGG
jgi:hypothetical protein